MKSFEFDWNQTFQEENDEIDHYENPKCIIAVDLKGKISLIEILNTEVVNDFILDVMDTDLRDYEFGEEILAGIYYSEIGINTYHSNNTECPDPDFELTFDTMKEIKLNLGEIYK